MVADWGGRVARGLRLWSAGAAALAVLVGVAALAGKWLEPPVAVCFVLCGVALWALRHSPSPLRRLVGDVAIGLAALLALLAIVRGLAAVPSICFLMIAGGLLGLDRAPVFRAGQRLAVAAGFIAFLTVVADAYPAGPMSADAYAAMMLVGLAIGVIAARPGRGATGILVQDTAGGTVARWLLPATMLGPFLVGALALIGVRAGHYGLDFTLALVTVANLSLFTALAWILAVRLHRTDARRLLAEADLRRVNTELEDRVRARTSELAASERQYRHLIEDSAEGIVLHRLGVVRFINAAGLRMFGVTDPAEAVGQPILDRIAPEHRETVAGRVAARLRGEPTPATVEIEGLRRDGSRFWLAATSTVVEWEGSPATLVSLLDISDRVRREAAEREAESFRSVTKLANAAAHEINNPLTVVGGNLQLLSERLGDRPDLARYFERGERAVRQIADMISHMTRITRLQLLTGLDTGGVPTLDLRRSSEPAPPAEAGEARSDAKGDAP
jgi:PAS domain S-box-containing protein